MSPQDECLLLHDVVPRLKSAIPIAVSHVGSEDDSELLQDGTGMVVKILANAHHRGRSVIAGNVASYTLQDLRSGCRTVGGSIADDQRETRWSSGMNVFTTCQTLRPTVGVWHGRRPRSTPPCQMAIYRRAYRE